MRTTHLRAALLALPLALAACATAAPAPPSASSPATVTAAGDARLAAALDSIFGDSLFAHANWGVQVKSLESGRVLYQRNPGKLLVPASNMKLVTGSAALETLGPDYRYATTVAAAGTVAGGVLTGDLVVRGSGDPTIAADFQGGDARAVFRAWADSLRAHGVRRITGRIVGDDEAFDGVPLGRGWAWDDLDAGYAAEIGALEFNLGIVTATVTAGAQADIPPLVRVEPQTAYVPVLSSAATVAPGQARDINVTRPDTGSGVVVTGSMPAGDTAAERTDIAVRNNTAYFVTVLRETLVAAGIDVRGAAMDIDELVEHSVDERVDRPTVGQTLFIHHSVPLRQFLSGFLKPSQNQVGELLLKTMGRELRGQGTAAAGISVVDSLARAWRLPPRELAQADGSGLSRYNLVAPELLVALLEHMSRSPNFDVLYSSLPIAGVDGTLAGRMKGTPLQGNVHAKTGTVSNVRSLSGYLTTAAGERMAFSMIVNHHTVAARDADRLAEAALLRVYALPRTR